MTLIKSISGIRGTIGGAPGDALTPLDVVRFTAAFASFMGAGKKPMKVVIGRDARISGPMVQKLVVGTLQGMGVDVVDLGLSTTPTVEVAVPGLHADAGIILTASHNPKQWNALKLLNGKGEFISAADGQKVLDIAEQELYAFADVDALGSYSVDDSWLDKHIQMILDLPLVDVSAIRAANFSVVCDCVNSSGGIFIPALLRALGVSEVTELFCDPTGEFPHNPEPLPEHLTEIASVIQAKKADLGIVVDPDVDRLAFVCEDGSMFGEEYTLVAVADYVLSKTKGNTVSNLSSTRALADVTRSHGGEYTASAVGEVNVVEAMKEVSAVIGGEGNGGIIYPEVHYGRDALVGVALFLSHLAHSKKSVSALRASYPNYVMAKKKIELQAGMDVDALLNTIATRYAHEKINTVDGVKIDFAYGWVHLRKSNTEPIIRIYAEAGTVDEVESMSDKLLNELKSLAAK